MNEKELLEKIKLLEKNNEWEKIIELLDSKESFRKDLKHEGLIFNLLFTYGKLTLNLIKEKYSLGLKYFKLTEDAYLYYLTQAPLSKCTKWRIYKSLAYIYRDLYDNTKIWSRNFSLANKTKEDRKYEREIHFEKNILRNKALYLYFSIVKNTFVDVNSAYRLGHLIMNIRTNNNQARNFTKNGAINSAYPKDIFRGLNIYQALTELVPLEVYQKEYRDFHNWLPTSDEENRYKKSKFIELTYFQQAIDLYLQLSDGDDKKRVRHNYIKAMYNYAKTSIDVVKNNNMFLNESNILGRSVTNRNGDFCYIKNWDELYAKDEREKVRRYLYLVAKEENYPLDDQALAFAAKFPNMNFAGEQANHVYYTIAKYILAYRVQLGESQSINLVIKYLLYSCLVNFHCAARYDKSKSFNEYPLILLSYIFLALRLRNEYKELLDEMYAGFSKNRNGKYFAEFNKVYNFFSKVQQALEMAQSGDPNTKEILNKIDKKKMKVHCKMKLHTLKTE